MRLRSHQRQPRGERFLPLLFGQGASTLPSTNRITTRGYDNMWPLKVGEMETNSLSQQPGGWEGRGRVKCDVDSSN